MLYCLAFMPEAPIQRFQSVWVSGFAKSWMRSMVIMKVLQLRSLTIIVVISKRIPNFVGEIQAMIDNDPSKSIRYIARDMGVPEVLIKQSIKTFGYSQTRKNQFLSKAMKDKRKGSAQMSPPTKHALIFLR